MAASSASGASSMVSSELMDGDRERSEVGVLGMLEAELREYIGYGSELYFCGPKDGDVLPEMLGLTARTCSEGALAL